MPRRVLKVTKRLGSIPVVAICTECQREFRVPLTLIGRTHAQTSLKEQFDRHVCKHG